MIRVNKFLNKSCQDLKAFNCFWKFDYYKIEKTKIKMRSKVTMVNDRGKFFNEKLIADNVNETKLNVKLFNPISKLLKAKSVYK